MKHHAVIFDMDGVLIDSEPNWKRALSEVYTSLGAEFPFSRGAETMGMRIDQATAHWYKELQWEGPSVPEVVEMILEKVEHYIRTDGKVLPGVQHAIDIARAAGAKTAVASSSYMRLIDAVMETIDIGPFDAIHSAEHDLNGKPAPDVYLRTAEVLGIAPEFCIVIEDAPKGVEAAKAAGMKCIAVPDPKFVSNEQMSHADVIIPSLEEFSIDLVQSLY